MKMNTLKNIQINVPDNIFGTKLLLYCFSHKHEISDNSQINETIYKIVSASLTERENKTWIGKLRLSPTERQELMSISIDTIKNAELSARIDDVLNYSSGLENKKNISTRYLSLFDIKKDCDYLIRAIDVRAISPLCEESFIETIINRLESNSFYGNQWKLVLIALSKSYKPLPVKFYDTIELKIKNFADNEQYDCERHLLKGLFYIGGISEHETSYRIALSHEREGLKVWNSREENTFYPTVVQFFKSAYDEISRVQALYPEDEKRIKKEYVEAQKYLVEMLHAVGVSTTFVNNNFKKQVDKCVKEMNIKCFEDVIIEWTRIPYTTKENINHYKTIVGNTSYLSFFGAVEKIGKTGNIEGKCSAERGIELECHNCMRLRTNYLVNMLIAEIENNNIEISENNLAQLVFECKPSFIPEDSLELWYLGFLHGLKREFIESSYILVPQIESALRGWAEEFCGDLAKLEKESNQDEANLTTVLKNLHGFIDDGFLNDMELFLNNSSSVNFRNKLLHGLLSVGEIIADTPYLLKIAADIYWGNKKYVKDKSF